MNRDVWAAKQAAQPSHTDIPNLFLRNTLLHKWGVHIVLYIFKYREESNIHGHSSVLFCFLYVKKGSLFSDFTSSEDIKLGKWYCNSVLIDYSH